MSEPETSYPQENAEKKTWQQHLLSWLPVVLIPLGVYFANVELQSYLGRKALEEVKLESLTLEQAKTRAAKEGKSILADMSAIWCPSCRKLDRDVLARTDVQSAIEQKYVFSRIEYESPEGKAFAERYNITGFPTLLVLDAKGSSLRRLPLSYSPEEFIRSL